MVAIRRALNEISFILQHFPSKYRKWKLQSLRMQFDLTDGIWFLMTGSGFGRGSNGITGVVVVDCVDRHKNCAQPQYLVINNLYFD